MFTQEHQSCICATQLERSTPIPPCLDLFMQARLIGKQLLTEEITAPQAAAHLLEQLLHITTFSRGALLFPTPSLKMAGWTQEALVQFPLLEPSSSGEGEQWHLLAISRTSIEEVIQALASQEFKGENDYPLAENTYDACYLLPITNNAQEQEYGAVAVRDKVHTSASELPSHAILLLFGENPSHKAMVETQARIALPACVREAAGTVLMMLFLALAQRPSSNSNRPSSPMAKLRQTEIQATLSHELRSPLTAIKGYVGTLLRHEQRLQPEERHDFLLAIDEASTQLITTIHHLLALSELETGTIVLAWSTVNVVKLIHESLLAAKRDWEHGRSPHEGERNFSLSVLDENGNLTFDEPVIEADQQRLQIVLTHLLHNALKYSPAGGNIEVTVRPVPHLERLAIQKEKRWRNYAWSYALTNAPMLELTVRDYGTGIPLHAQDYIFERFGRADTSLTREVNGLGLGLTISQHIIELHNGIIWVESEEGKGSTFHIWLPYKGEG